MSFMTMLRQKFELPDPSQALPGREERFLPQTPHVVLGRSMLPPFPDGIKTVLLGLGCFWGAERLFWQMDGVWVTAVGYAGGMTPNPTYNETCTGRTGHTEAVLVAYDPEKIDLNKILSVFWESHDPTQGMRQGNDIGTQYRSAIYAQDDATLEIAKASGGAYQAALRDNGRGGTITTEIKALPLEDFFYAEDYHQQYLSKNPNGYCGLQGTGVSCPLPAAS